MRQTRDMCGIAGYVGLPGEQGSQVLRRMLRAQAHRGPSGEDVFVRDRYGLGHRRLAVIDPAGGAQPMQSADGRHVIVYNGETYNYRELRQELIGLGHQFRTASDTEVVLASWRQWGVAAFDRINGMFALAIVDTQTGEITLARDQFGIKPIYLAESDGRVLFASELRPIIATGLVPRQPDDVTIFRYLRFRVHDDTERTFFAGISRLMPGEMATISPTGTITRRRYTTLFDDLRALAAEPRRYDATARAEFADGLHEAIRARLVSDVPVGTALSGGLDSSTVVATIHGLLSQADPEAAAVGARQQSFSAIFPGERNDEERYVDAVAENRRDILKVHKVRPSVDGFLDDMLDFVRTQEEPVISTGPYAQYCVMREASQHVTVMLDGQGADEMMAGYFPYYLVYLRQLRARGQYGRAATATLTSADVLWRAGRFLIGDKLNRRTNTPAIQLLAPEFAAAHREQRFDIVRDDLKLRLEDDLFRHSLPSLLRYEDRNTMRFSLEGRVPFLDHHLLRLLWSLDDTAILHGSWNKRALRDATVDTLPPLINRRRNKIGFTTPEDAWFGQMSGYINDIFESDSFSSRPYFTADVVRSLFADLLAGRGGAETMTFWRFLNLELWLREFIDTDPTATLTDADQAIAVS